MVRSDGSVFWSRNGRIDVNCRYTGLVAFPFDELKCSFELGGWAMSGIHQGLQFSGVGYSLEQGQATSGESYSEYSISKIESDAQTYFYATVPGPASRTQFCAISAMASPSSVRFIRSCATDSLSSSRASSSPDLSDAVPPRFRFSISITSAF